MPVRSEIHPIRFVQFRSNQKIEIINLVIFPNEGSCGEPLRISAKIVSLTTRILPTC